jgi:hypothetical protein
LRTVCDPSELPFISGGCLLNPGHTDSPPHGAKRKKVILSKRKISLSDVYVCTVFLVCQMRLIQEENVFIFSVVSVVGTELLRSVIGNGIFTVTRETGCRVIMLDLYCRVPEKHGYMMSL